MSVFIYRMHRLEVSQYIYQILRNDQKLKFVFKEFLLFYTHFYVSKFPSLINITVGFLFFK